MKFFIGLLLGIMVAGGTAYYLNKAPNPFLDKNLSANAPKQTEQGPDGSGPLILAPGTKMQQVLADQASSEVRPQKHPASTPSYDFYDVLQGNKDVTPKASASEAQVTTQAYLLQVGAFANQDSANNMKARLALLGYSAKIKPQQQNDQMVNRVLIGPLSNLEDAEKLVSELKEQAISTTIIKINH